MSTSRRDFLKTLGGMALLTIVPRQVLGGPKFTAPSDQLTKGIIGVAICTMSILGSVIRRRKSL